MNKDTILTYLTEKEIFEYYLGIEVKINKKFNSPLRNDKNPSCVFYVNDFGRLRFADKTRNINEDCFGIVCYLKNCSFSEALDIIKRDLLFNIEERVPIKKEIYEKPPSKIDIKFRKSWKKEDVNYWINFNIDIETLIYFNVKPIEKVWFNDNLIHYHTSNDLCYCYLDYSSNSYELYFPNRKKGRKFLVYNKPFIKGLSQFKNNQNYFVLTKSLKDVMSLYSFNITNVLGLSSETILFPKEIYDSLISNINFTLFDYDITGIQCAKRHKLIYPEFINLFLDKKNKDFSTYVYNNGIKKTKELINYVKNNFNL